MPDLKADQVHPNASGRTKMAANWADALQPQLHANNASDEVLLVEPNGRWHLRIEGQPDATQLEFAFDAQTSGGMLIAVDESRGDELVQRVRDQGATAACIVGQVLPQQDVALIVRA